MEKGTYKAGARPPNEVLSQLQFCRAELGMDHYEVRQYPGWHHHMLTCMLAHFFLWHLQLRLEKKSTSAYGLASPQVIGSGVAPQSLPGG